MSTPPVSQAPFISAPPIARGPPVFAMQPMATPGALRPPVILAPGLPRPLPVPQLAKPPPAQPLPRPGPAVSSPLTLNPPTRDGKALPVPTIVPPKQTTLYVGKIAAGISDDLIKQLLDACGAVKSWKRMEDPDTKALKPFGFCEYEEADGVVRALNLLQNLSVGGQELLLKCNTGTQKYIDYIETRKAKDAEEGVQAMDVDSKEGDEKSTESAAELDNKALETVMGLVSMHAQQLPPPPEAVAAADSFLSSLKEETERSARGEKPSRDRSKSRHREGRAERDEEKALEASFGRERETERKEAQARLHHLDQAYKTALRKWEAQESDNRKNAQRDREHEKDLAKERQRQLKADLEADTEAGEEPWQRKLYAGSRRAADRKRWREKEANEDEADREKEAEEAVKRAKYEEEAAANGHTSHSPTPATSPDQSQPSAHPRLQDPNDSITQAMMNAAKAPRKPVPAPAPEPQPLASPTAREAPPPAKKAPVLAAFGGEEDEDKPRRTLKPIAYTEEEQRAAQRKEPISAKDKAAAIKRLIAKVPTETKAVFSYPIDWKAFDEGGQGLRKKIQAWVEKKTAELLGVAEASMVDFIMSKLDEHISAKKLLEELLQVLDDEANPFVFKLFRMVIFETLKQAAEIQE